MLSRFTSTVVLCAGLIFAGPLHEPGAEQSTENSPMHIAFERSGGFAGMRLTTTIDPKVLSPEEAAKIWEMVEAANFFNLPPAITSTKPGADRFHYKVIVETKERRHTVEIDEGATPPSLRPLLDWLTAKARKHP